MEHSVYGVGGLGIVFLFHCISYRDGAAWDLACQRVLFIVEIGGRGGAALLIESIETGEIGCQPECVVVLCSQESAHRFLGSSHFPFSCCACLGVLIGCVYDIPGVWSLLVVFGRRLLRFGRPKLWIAWLC